MFQGIKDRIALRRWTKSPLGSALRTHGHNFFWNDDAPFAYFAEDTKLKHCAELHSMAADCLNSANPVLAVREKLANYVVTFAPLMVAGMRPDGKQGNELYEDSPYISGQLRPHISAIANHIDELGQLRFEDPDISDDDLGDFCTSRASLLLFYCNGLNNVSIYLEDRVSLRSEWYRAFVQAAMVFAEDHIRRAVELPSLLPSTTGGLVYSSFMEYVINGDSDPFYSWCRDFPDYYLWGHGPKPHAKA